MSKNWLAAILSQLRPAFVALICLALPPLPAGAATPAPVGDWVTASHDAVIEISRCGDGLCGAIKGIVLTPHDKVPVAWAGQSQCGLEILQTSGTPQDGGWSGWITDPRDGTSYHARLTVDENGNLRLRGYVGLPLFGRTQTWTPYNGPVGTSDCRLSSTATQTAAMAPASAG